ncbi:hypothetical protein [Cohnella hashimotonis]|uniref:Tail fiber protein n=1 Tax=Cohnella hashimotonis TaxID=2826895 RepID=A0ABT6TKP2_9BACL|nr:hypothetical protein [Cohnella hashimotonis]MDI4647407.1 hypothetical protein [Cohnella hashimotonis]
MSLESQPIIYQLRAGTSDDPYVSYNNSPHKVVNGVVILQELPVRMNKVQINGYSEIISGIPSNLQYMVDYNTGIIKFNQNAEGANVTVTYRGRGLASLPANRIYTQAINGNVIETLEDVIIRGTSENPGGGTDIVTSVTSTNSDISVTNPSSTPQLTLNSGVGANKILKLDSNGQVTADILKDGTSNKVYTANDKTKVGQIGTLSSLQTTAKTDLVSAVNELFTSASNGKSAIATAITGKGVAASSSDSFNSLATKIGSIAGEGSEGTGGTALPEQVLQDQTFTNDFGLQTGTMIDRLHAPDKSPNGWYAQEGALEVYPQEGFYKQDYNNEEHAYVLLADENFKAENIKKDIEIFGLLGTYESSDVPQGGGQFGGGYGTAIPVQGDKPTDIKFTLTFENLPFSPKYMLIQCPWLSARGIESPDDYIRIGGYKYIYKAYWNDTFYEDGPLEGNSYINEREFSVNVQINNITFNENTITMDIYYREAFDICSFSDVSGVEYFYYKMWA